MPDDATRNQNLDNLLNSALSSYAEPDKHLESRILAHLAAARASEPVPTRRRWLPWAIALPIAACLILAATLTPRSAHQPTTQQTHRAIQPSAQTAKQSIPSPLPAISSHSPEPQTVAVHVAHPTAPKPAPLPKQDVFPAPHPLSPEEQAMVNFAANTPPSQIQAMQQAQQQSDKPLHIAAIVIQPIKFPDEPKTE